MATLSYMQKQSITMLSKYLYFKMAAFNGCSFELSQVSNLPHHNKNERIIYATCHGKLMGALQFAVVDVEGLDNQAIVVDHYYVGDDPNQHRIVLGLLMRLQEFALSNAIKQVVGANFKSIKRHLSEARVRYFCISTDIVKPTDSLFAQAVSRQAGKKIDDPFVLNVNHSPIALSFGRAKSATDFISYSEARTSLT